MSAVLSLCKALLLLFLMQGHFAVEQVHLNFMGVFCVGNLAAVACCEWLNEEDPDLGNKSYDKDCKADGVV